MKSFLVVFSYFSLLLYTPSSLAVDVILDPGHGGKDLGGEVLGIYEEPLVFQFTKSLQQELTELKISSSLTRKAGKTLSLEERVQITIKAKPKLFVSLHANIHKDKNIEGIEFYLEPATNLFGHTDFLSFLSTQSNLEALSPAKHPRFYYPDVVKYKLKSPLNIIILDMLRMKTRRESLHLAESLKKQCSSKSEIREGHFHLVRNLPYPSILIELGYLSNSRDLKKLISEDYRLKLAKELALGIKEYLKTTKD